MNSPSPQLAGLLLVLAGLPFVVTQPGCIALNVPSQRFHDPADGGGVFGAWPHPEGSIQHPHRCISTHSPTDDFVGFELESDPCEVGVGPEGQPKPPEIPWPRFHPVPTRPVFGPASF